MLSDRQLRWARAWYDPKVQLEAEDWQYLLYLSLACGNAFGIGLLIGCAILVTL